MMGRTAAGVAYRQALQAREYNGSGLPMPGPTDEEQLQITVLGVVYDCFVLGVHSPDDSSLMVP